MENINLQKNEINYLLAGNKVSLYFIEKNDKHEK